METAISPTTNRLANTGIWARDGIRALWRDAAQRRAFGPQAPRYAEEIRLSVDNVAGVIRTPISRWLSGHVLAGDWDLDPSPFSMQPKLAYCLRHWVDGQTWDDAGATAYHTDMIDRLGVIDGCRTEAQVRARLERLDSVFARTKDTGILLPKSELRRPNFRESGGILIHIGRDGRGLFGSGGNHRFAIALALRLDQFPAQIGLVHPDAIDAIARLRRPKV
ncbi:MAG: hypothetical protein QNJ35_07930 [Paracoccaceae bacterium]|nr:hypothetical protein [Paracoccaceae bacterium]